MAVHKDLKLTPSVQAQRKERLSAWVSSPQLKTEQNCSYRLDGVHPTSKEKILVKQYRNGTYTLQTQSDACLVDALGVLGLKSTVEASVAHTAYFPYGADESGKGDYFGPLVTACVQVKESQLPILKRLGITDSKAMTDAKIKEVAPQLVDALGIEQVAFLVLMPEGYNRQYDALKAQGKHLNHLLAMMHAKTVAGLMQKQGTLIDTPCLMVDQFTQGPHLLDALKEHAPQVKVSQSTKAELSHPAVAAASVVARYKFLQSMAQLREQSGYDLPLGASAKVVSMGKQVFRAEGYDGLRKAAKLHFKTTIEVTQ
ncbi:MAG: ribonuclease HIII [Vampirovibrionales bacterium]|jgi:ribonuclease HIII|nr:ribonuclease HIII [Vampirovibrionales bacterium]